MARKNRDSVMADAALKRSNRFGDNWDPVAWGSQDFFHQNKAMAAQFAPLEARSRALFDEAATNLEKPEGVKYQKDIEQSLSKWMQQVRTRRHRSHPIRVHAPGRSRWRSRGSMDAPPHSDWQLSVQAHLRRAREERSSVYDATASRHWLKIKLDPATSVAAKESSALAPCVEPSGKLTPPASTETAVSAGAALKQQRWHSPPQVRSAEAPVRPSRPDLPCWAPSAPRWAEPR
jgi:hypothetical protein